MQAKQRGVSVLLILVMLLALGLRLFRIQAQSLWNDEGTSVALAARDLRAITEGAANDIHPPLYYYVLHLWMKLFGNSELSVRSLSALMGTVLVLLTFALGRRVSGRAPLYGPGNAVGLLAALFAALSPFQIYYSQEARMYVLSAVLAALSMYAFTGLLSHWQAELAGVSSCPSPLRRYWVHAAYALSTTLLLYTHYFAVTVVVAQNLAFLYWRLSATRKMPSEFSGTLPTQTRRARDGTREATLWSTLLCWGALQVTIAASYLPWLLLAGKQLRVWPAVSQPLRLTGFALDVLRVFSLGLSVEPRPSPVQVGFALLLLLAMAGPCLPGRRDASQEITSSPGSMPQIISLLYLLVPVGLMYVLSLRRPMYNPKFLLLCTPPFHLFLAQGVLLLAGVHNCSWRGLGAPNEACAPQMARTHPWGRMLIALAACAIVLGACIYSLQAYYFNPRYARDDYRGITRYIQAVERQDDAVLINAPGQIETFAYYYRGNLPLYPLPGQRPLDEVQTEADLRELIKGRGRIFAVLWATDESDPGRFVEGWLDQHAYKAMDSWYGNVRLVVYAVPAESSAMDTMHALQVNLGNQVRLVGYYLPTTEVMSGDILQLTLVWQAIAPMSRRYKVFTHILDARGHLVGQRDAEPGGGARITTLWKEQEQVVDNYGVPILAGTPPGDYILEIGMYGLDDGQRLTVIESEQAVSDRILLQSVRVLPATAPPPLSVLGMRKQWNAQFADVTLLGYDLSKLGYEHQPDAPLHPGDILHLTLFWQAPHRPQVDLALVLQLQDDKGKVRLERQGQPTEGQYPTRQWNANEIVRDQHNLPLPADLPTGRYHIQLTVQRLPDGQQVGSLLRLVSLMVK